MIIEHSSLYFHAKSLLRNLLNFLDEKDLRATFFTVGSRVIERPQVLIEEYMKGHELSVHTWSHHVMSSAYLVLHR